MFGKVYTPQASKTRHTSTRTTNCSPSSSHSTSSMRKLAVFLVLLISLLEVTNGQNIHFSNGWYSGKKRSAPSPAATAASLGTVSRPMAGTDGFSACVVRPDLGDIIRKLVADEILRLQATCTYGIPRSLRDIIESTANKADKW